MASGALIPKRSDIMSLVAGQSLHEISAQVSAGEHGGNGAQELLGHIHKHPAQPRYIRRESAERLSPIRRSTSAQSVNSSYTKNRQHYQRCIEYLQDQHKQTLSKLHQEVQDLKHENKKLHFKILVEDEGGVASVVKQTLSINTDKTNISSDILLQETIKDLKVKLKLSEDTLQHQTSTIKTLNKQLKLFKRVDRPLIPRPPAAAERRERGELAPVKNELLAKNRMISSLEAERDTQKSKIEELQISLRVLRAKLDEYGKERQLVGGSSGNSAHSGSPRPPTNFIVTNSASRHNLVNIAPGDTMVAKPQTTKLPPLAKGANLRSPRNSLVPKNSRVDIAKRTRRVQKMRQAKVEDNDDYLL